MTDAAAGSRQIGRHAIRRVVFSQEQIRQRVEALGREITAAYGDDDDLLVLGLLKGSFVFLADLVRQIQCPLQVDFLIASSYGTGKVSSGEVRMLYDAARKLEGRAVIVVEDILDSGKTVNTVCPLLEARRPRSLEICALLRKPGAELDREPRWVGFDAPPEFLVGYGLDHGEDLRHLPYIAAL